jgi:hypothetical protein
MYSYLVCCEPVPPALHWLAPSLTALASPYTASHNLAPRTEFITLLLAAPELTELILDSSVGGKLFQNDESQPISHLKLSSLALRLHDFVEGKGPFGVVPSAPFLYKLTFISIPCNSRVKDTPFVCHNHPKILSLPIMDENEVIFAAEISKRLPDVHAIEVGG